MTTKKNALGIILTVLFACILMAFIESVFRPGYAIKSAIKAILFLTLPLIYIRLHKGHSLRSLFQLRLKKLPFFLLLGIGVYAFILGFYFLFGRFFDLSNITVSLKNKIGVNEQNFVFVALYISFVNSFLEEFFFRGFSFLLLKKYAGKPFAFCFSAAVFSLYHITMMTGWFSNALLLLLIATLFAAGLFFDYLDQKANNIYASFAVHMFANFSVNTIGFILFGLL